MARPRRDVVVDTSVVVPACVSGGLRFPGPWRFRAPRLMWSEAISALHTAQWRGDLTPGEARSAREALVRLPIEVDEPDELAEQTWLVADELGLAKTYDAEFVALARVRDALLVTADVRLHRAARSLGFVVDPVELISR